MADVNLVAFLCTIQRCPKCSVRICCFRLFLSLKSLTGAPVHRGVYAVALHGNLIFALLVTTSKQIVCLFFWHFARPEAHLAMLNTFLALVLRRVRLQHPAATRLPACYIRGRILLSYATTDETDDLPVPTAWLNPQVLVAVDWDTLGGLRELKGLMHQAFLLPFTASTVFLAAHFIAASAFFRRNRAYSTAPIC